MVFVQRGGANWQSNIVSIVVRGSKRYRPKRLLQSRICPPFPSGSRRLSVSFYLDIQRAKWQAHSLSQWAQSKHISEIFLKSWAFTLGVSCFPQYTAGHFLWQYRERHRRLFQLVLCSAQRVVSLFCQKLTIAAHAAKKFIPKAMQIKNTSILSIWD